MIVEEDSAKVPDPSLTVCPMCGGKNRPTAYRCTDCGEELLERAQVPQSADQEKLESLTRALSGMYAAIACISLSTIVFGLQYGQRNITDERFSIISLITGFGMIFVAVGVALNSLVAIRIGMWLSGFFALCLIATCAMSPLALFLIPGILQSRRILKLHQKIDREAEQNQSDAGVFHE